MRPTFILHSQPVERRGFHAAESRERYAGFAAARIIRESENDVF